MRSGNGTTKTVRRFRQSAALPAARRLSGDTRWPALSKVNHTATGTVSSAACSRVFLHLQLGTRRRGAGRANSRLLLTRAINSRARKWLDQIIVRAASMPSTRASSPARADSRMTGTSRSCGSARTRAAAQSRQPRHHHVGQHQIRPARRMAANAAMPVRNRSRHPNVRPTGGGGNRACRRCRRRPGCAPVRPGTRMNWSGSSSARAAVATVAAAASGNQRSASST